LRRLYEHAMHVVKWLNRNDHAWVVKLGRRLGLKRVLQRGHSPLPPMSVEERAYLDHLYATEIAALEHLIGRPIPAWRRS
jgi:hypothetical protein